jgi:hypothetical protein
LKGGLQQALAHQAASGHFVAFFEHETQTDPEYPWHVAMWLHHLKPHAVD